MTCKYCRSEDFPLDFNFCPMCGREMYMINAKRKLANLAKDILESDSEVRRKIVCNLHNLTKDLGLLGGEYTLDENGNLLKVEREPFNIMDDAFDGQPIKSFDWENVDISREMLWLEADSIINGGNDEREKE